MGNLLRLVDPAGNRTDYAYDGYNRVTTETAYEGATAKTRKYVYDGSGNLTITVDRNGRAIRSKYDRLDRLQTEWWYASEADARNNATTTVATAHSDAIDSFYDGLGRLAERRSVHRTLAGTYAFDSRVTESFAYDGLDRVTERSNQSLENPATLSTSGAPAAKQTYVYEYNGPHLQIGRYQWVSGVDVAFTSSWTGPFGELTDVTDVDAGAELSYEQYAATFAYDKSGALTTTTRSTDWDAAISGYRNEVQTAYGYDKAGRLAGLSHSRSIPGGPPQEGLLGFGYSYDAANRMSRIVASWNHTIPGLARLTDTHDFIYDNAGQLTSYTGVTDSGPGNGVTSGTYNYLANGNRTTSTETGGGGDSYLPGPQNRIAEDSTYRYAYDQEGNLTCRTRKSDNVVEATFTWDHRNRLTQVVLAGQSTIDYRYGADDQLVRRSDDPAGAPPAVVEHYVNEGGRRVMTLDAAGHVARRYHFGPAGQLLVDQVFDAAGQQTDLRLPLGDHQNSTRVVLDGDDGQQPLKVRQTVDYAAFGRVAMIRDGAAAPVVDGLGQPNLNALDTVFGYDGAVTDSRTSWVQMGARWYSPDLGRFVSTDPIEDGANWYAFAGNDPVNYADPSGLSPSFHPLGNSTLAPAYIDSRSILSGLGAGGTNLNLSGSYLTNAAPRSVIDPYGGQFHPQTVNLGLGTRPGTSTTNAFANLPTAPYGGSGVNFSSGLSPTNASPAQWQRSLGAAAPVAPAPDLGGVDGRLVQTIREQATRNRVLSPPPPLPGIDGNFIVTAPPNYPTVSAETRTPVQLNADRQRAFEADVRTSYRRIISGQGGFEDVARIDYHRATQPPSALDVYYAAEGILASFAGVPGTRAGVNASKARVPQAGVYLFPDATSPGSQYVGQSGNLPQRIQAQRRAGRLPAGVDPSIIEVPGGKTAREVIEQRAINQLGGTRDLPGSQTSNIRNPIGAGRRALVEQQYGPIPPPSR